MAGKEKIKESKTLRSWEVGSVKVKRALISVSDKTGIEKLAKGLSELGVEIISTGGTARFLREKGVNLKEVSEVTGFPEILEGRVKTLHPAIHAGILARREKKDHMKALAEHRISPIDLVVVNLYPFQQTVAKKGVTLEDAIENIDIGGPTLLRAAAKNYQSVGVVVNPQRYGEVLEELEKTGGLSDNTRMKLAVEAFEHTAEYDFVIHKYLEQTQKVEKFPEIFRAEYRKVQELRYGENPHQGAALYRDVEKREGSLLTNAKQLQGKELSFNNLVDLDSALNLVVEFDEPTAVVLKHNSPCGVGSGKTILEAYKKGHAGDPQSAYGGVVALNREVDEETAGEITSTFIEALIAPGYSEKALKVLKSKPNLRVMELPLEGKAEGLQLKQVSGGLLIQDRDTVLLTSKGLKTVTLRKPTQKELDDLLFAWKVVKHVKSNAIAIAKDLQVVGVGAGQMSRVDAVEIAVKKAGDRSRGSVLASDAFFPFKDSVEKAAAAGVTAIIQPGGSIRDAESIEAADKHGIAMVFTGMRHFRH